MKKKYFVVPILAVLIPFIFNSCEKPEEIIDPPQADFSVTQLYSTSDITFSFTDWSSDSPDEWLWTFEGGYPSTSTEENPTVTYSESGTYDVTLYVSNEGGDDEIVLYDYINVVQFNNPLFTDMDVTVNEVTKTMAPDSYVQFAQIDNTSVSYYAETFGETSSGTVVGEEVFWDSNVSLLDYSSYNLILNSDFIFFNITNNSDYNLNPFIVNYGTTDETEDDILILNNGVKYSTGYYNAYSEMEVFAFYEYSTTGVSWLHPYNLTIPWENNQYVDLNYNKSIQGKTSEPIDREKTEPAMLYPAIETGSKMAVNPDAKDMVQS
ncbi:MAG: PKD domain-containing protein, partial [Bacteroidales bacterium]|nr:PKD domain-containing protein [Bacteroidales bacterium]